MGSSSSALSPSEAKKRANEEAARKKQQEEAARTKQQEADAKKRAAEEAAKKKQEEDAKKRAAEEAAKKLEQAGRLLALEAAVAEVEVALTAAAHTHPLLHRIATLGAGP